MSRGRRPARGGRLLAAAAIAALAVLGAAAAADAHAVLVRSAPAARSTVGGAPDRVQLWFSERLEPAFSTASVWSAAGARVDRQDARVAPDDPRRLSVSLPPVEPGRYTVRYRVLSVDGHVVEAEYSFTIRRPPGR
jgi:methionine-rich copper-binding protein CopC